MGLVSRFNNLFTRYTLRDAIFSSKYISYIVYRMRFFLVVSLISLSVEIVELFLIRGAISALLIEKIVFMRLALSLAAAGWWGCLEIMREYVRGRYSFSDRLATNESISHWLVLSVIFAAWVVIFTMGYFLHQNFQFSPFENLIFQLYIIGFAIACILEFWIETYRSGALAIRRIYRPLTSIIGPGILSLIILILLWHFFGVIGLPFAFIIARLLDGAVKVYYIGVTYRNLRLRPLIFPRIKSFFKFCLKVPKFNSIMSYLAGIALSIETLLFILFFSDMKSYPNFILYLFMLRLIYHSYSSWGLAFFYYDFKKMCEEAYPPFYNQFLKALLIASVVISLIFYTMTIPLTYYFYREHLLLYSAVILVFFIFVSIFSYMEIHTFSQNRYADLIASSIIGVGLFLIGVYFYPSFLGISLSLIIALIAIVLLLIKSWLPSMATINSIKKQSIYTLLFNLKNSKSGFIINKIKTNPQAGRKKLNQFLSELALSMDQRGWICPLRSNEFLIIETQKHATIDKKTVLNTNPSLTKSFHPFPVATRIDCLNFVHREFQKEASDNPFLNRLKGDLDLDTQILTLFKESFPEDHEFDLLHVNWIYTQADKQAIYAAIEASYLVPLAIMRELSYSSALFFKSVPILFLIKKEDKKFKNLFNWNKFIHYMNLEKFKKIGYKLS